MRYLFNSRFSPVRTLRAGAILSLILVQMACAALQSGGQAPANNEPQAAPTATAASVAVPTPIQPTAVPPTEPPALQPTLDRSRIASGLACVGSSSSGMSCLTETGWQVFTRENSGLETDSVSNLETCQGNVLILGGLSMSTFDGQNFAKYGQGWSGDIAQAAACSPDGSIWVGLLRSVARMDGGVWTTFARENIAPGGSPADLVQDIAVAPDGQVWAVVSSQVAVFDGTAWVVKNDGLPNPAFLSKITFDAQGLPWVGYNQGVLSFDGSRWTANKNPDLGGVKALGFDSSGRLWVGSSSAGVFMLEDGKWTQFDLNRLGLASNNVRSLEVDSSGRVWAGTEWGLAIYDNGAWQAYRMENSDLADNDVRSVAVVAGGPALVAPVAKGPGTLSGRVLDASRNPVPNAKLEICVETLGSIYYGDTPCSSQPFLIKAQTDGEGRFSISDIPAGLYIITIFTDGSWAQLTSQYSAFSERVLVEADKETDIGDLTLQ